MPPEKVRSKKGLYIVGILISVVCIWYTFRGVPIDEFVAAMKQVRMVPLLLAIAVSTACFPLRIPRWRLLLPDQVGGPIPTAALWHPITIGFTANNVMLLRVGEVVRAATLTRTAAIPFPTGFASLAVERVLDGLVIIGLLGVGLVGSDFETGKMVGGSTVAALATRMGLICIGTLLVSIAAAWRPDLALKLLRKLMPSRPWAEHFLHFAEKVLNGLTAMRDPRRAVPVIGWSILLWLINALGFWFGLMAFGIDLNFFAAMVLQGVVVIMIAVPGGPGGFGQFEYGMSQALMLYGVDDVVAKACAVGFHIATLPPILLMGAWSLRKVGGTLRGTAETAAT